VVVARGLRKRYADVEAVRGIDLEVHRGEIFAFLGPNGAGKTTAVEIMEGYRSRSGGDIVVLGVDPAEADRAWRNRIGVVLQESRAEPELTVRECLELYAGYYDNPRPVAETIGLVGLDGHEAALAGRLSGGQQRRLDVALALVGDPELVFLDEPTTGLDPQARHNLWDVIRSINQVDGKTVILTTHYLEEAEQLCDRVAIMDAAHIVALDTPAGLIESLDADARVAWGDEDGDHAVYTKDAQGTVHEILDRARDSGSRLSDLSVRGPSLEDVFLQLTGKEFRE